MERIITCHQTMRRKAKVCVITFMQYNELVGDFYVLDITNKRLTQSDIGRTFRIS
jgi:hypothetical protein